MAARPPSPEDSAGRLPNSERLSNSSRHDADAVDVFQVVAVVARESFDDGGAVEVEAYRRRRGTLRRIGSELKEKSRGVRKRVDSAVKELSFKTKGKIATASASLVEASMMRMSIGGAVIGHGSTPFSPQVGSQSARHDADSPTPDPPPIDLETDAADSSDAGHSSYDALLRGWADAGPSVDFLTKHGWRSPGLVDAIVTRGSRMIDLPLEDATPAEESAVAKMLADLLGRQGLDRPPDGWRRQHYTRGRLISYLRSRNGDRRKAVERCIECMEFMDSTVELARGYEAAAEHQRELSHAAMQGGMFGVDRRGASVCYSKFGVDAWATLASRTSWSFFVDFDWYSALFFWDTLYKESVVAGKSLAGRLLVLDLSGISLAKGKRASDFVSKQMSAWPAKAPERILRFGPTSRDYPRDDCGPIAR